MKIETNKTNPQTAKTTRKIPQKPRAVLEQGREGLISCSFSRPNRVGRSMANAERLRANSFGQDVKQGFYSKTLLTHLEVD